jgi:hypothetical protein
VAASAVEESEFVHVRLSDAGLAEEFLGFLRRAECVAAVGEVAAHAEGIAVKVEVPQAYDEDQARMEVALYLRVWEAVHPGSGAELLD